MKTKKQKTIFGKQLFVDQQKYLRVALDFFREVGLKKKDIIKLLRRLRKRYLLRLLHALIFYQYAEKVINQKDDILRPVLLTCLIDGIEEKGSLIKKIQRFLKRLDNEDKIYLLNRVRVLRSKNGEKEFRVVFYGLVKRHRIWRYYPRDVKYEDVDPEFKKINHYIDKIALHLYGIRNYVLHEAKQILYALHFDEVYNTLPFSFFFYETDKRRRKRKYHISSHIEFVELRKIIKKGVVKKIEEKRR